MTNKFKRRLLSGKAERVRPRSEEPYVGPLLRARRELEMLRARRELETFLTPHGTDFDALNQYLSSLTTAGPNPTLAHNDSYFVIDSFPSGQ